MQPWVLSSGVPALRKEGEESGHRARRSTHGEGPCGGTRPSHRSRGLALWPKPPVSGHIVAGDCPPRLPGPAQRTFQGKGTRAILARGSDAWGLTQAMGGRHFQGTPFLKRNLRRKSPLPTPLVQNQVQEAQEHQMAGDTRARGGTTTSHLTLAQWVWADLSRPSTLPCFATVQVQVSFGQGHHLSRTTAGSGPHVSHPPWPTAALRPSSSQPYLASTSQPVGSWALASTLLPGLCLAAPGLPQLPQRRIPVLDT